MKKCRICSILLVGFLLIYNMSMSVYANEEETEEPVIHTKDEYIELYGENYEEDPLYKDYDENEYIGPQLRSNYRVLNVPTYAQRGSTWCGVASSTMVIDFLNYQPNLTQEILAKELGTNSSGTNYGPIATALRKYTGVNYGWRFSDGFSNSYGPMSSNIGSGLPVISGVGTYKLRNGWETARPGKEWDHYVVVHGYQNLPGGPEAIMYTDPWYESPVLGRHWISIEQFKDAIYYSAKARAVIW